MTIRGTSVTRMTAQIPKLLRQMRRLIGWSLIGLLGPTGFNTFKRKTQDLITPPGADLSRRVQRLSQLTSYETQSYRRPIAPFDPQRMHITWVIPDFAAGAGGHMTIFRIASFLESFGHNVSFLVQNPSSHRNGRDAAETINSHFQPFRGQVNLIGSDLPRLEGDALIATDFFSCYPAQALSGFRRKFYFVQDHEAQFHPMGTKALLADNTYFMGFDCLCAGDWLATLMQERFKNWSMSWPLAYDPSVYFVNHTTPRSTKRIAFYSRFTTERRAVELGVMALEILHNRSIDFHVDFFGYPLNGLRVRFPYTDHGILPSTALGNLYREAALGMVFSTTNHSLVNREMMACGLPVVDLDVESVRHVFPDNVLIKAKPDPNAIADALEHLLNKSSYRDALREKGLDHIAGLSWESSSRIVEHAIVTRISESN